MEMQQQQAHSPHLFFTRIGIGITYILLWTVFPIKMLGTTILVGTMHVFTLIDRQIPSGWVLIVIGAYLKVSGGMPFH
jgi:hypothetical protein